MQHDLIARRVQLEHGSLAVSAAILSSAVKVACCVHQQTCEGKCPLFLHLPKLARLANQVGDRPGECDGAVKDQICQGCILKESAGDYCPDYAARTCPLSRYSTAVISRLQRMMPLTPDI